jgi:hypothetical protein
MSNPKRTNPNMPQGLSGLIPGVSIENQCIISRSNPCQRLDGSQSGSEEFVSGRHYTYNYYTEEDLLREITELNAQLKKLETNQ